MSTLKSLKAAAAVLTSFSLISLAIAQSNPPTTANPNPATGAGQQSSQSTPMGSTGTQGNSNTGTPASSSDMGSSGSTSNSANPAAPAQSNAGASASRPPRADRN